MKKLILNNKMITHNQFHFSIFGVVLSLQLPLRAAHAAFQATKLLAFTVLFVGLHSEGLQAQTLVYSQTSLAGTTAVTPGLFDELGLLAGADSQRRDFYEIFTNNVGLGLQVNRAIVFGAVYTVSNAVLVPVIIGTANDVPNMLVPDTNPSHVLATAAVPISAQSGTNCFTSTSGLTGCPITISFSPGVIIPPGGRLAFGFIVPLEQVVDAMLFGTDTLPNELSSTTPPYFTGFYATNAVGNLALATGNHYLVIEAEPLLAACDGPSLDRRWKNHGQYVSTVTEIAEVLLADGLINEEQKDALISGAAKSSCGNK